MNRYICPVCGYDRLPAPAANYEICPSCGTEFGYADFGASHYELQREWLEQGARWHSAWVPPPPGWEPYAQLERLVETERLEAPEQIDGAFFPGMFFGAELVLEPV